MLRIPMVVLAACLAIAGLTALPAIANAAPAGLVASDVAFRSHGITLHGTILAPAQGGGRRPGIVLVSGSRPGPRSAVAPDAEAFARRGLVALIYDKRT